MSLVVPPVVPEEEQVPPVETPAAAYTSDNPEADAKALATLKAAEDSHEGEEEPAPEGEEEPTPEAEKEAEAQVGAVDYAKYSEELTTGGELTAESYAELEGKGFPKEVVDTYVRGLQASAAVEVDAILAPIGGAGEYAKMTEWAQANLSEEALTEYNAAVANPAAARYAVKDLAAQYRAAEGTTPNLLKPSSSVNSSGLAPFESSAQMVTAMRDGRYKTDSAYRNQVQQRLARSNF